MGHSQSRQNKKAGEISIRTENTNKGAKNTNETNLNSPTTQAEPLSGGSISANSAVPSLSINTNTSSTSPIDINVTNSANNGCGETAHPYSCQLTITSPVRSYHYHSSSLGSPVNFQTSVDSERHLLLQCLFHSLDLQGNNYLNRVECLEYIENEPFLQSLNTDYDLLIYNQLNHDEDSNQISFIEFQHQFSLFSHSQLIQFIVHLLKPATNRNFFYNSNENKYNHNQANLLLEQNRHNLLIQLVFQALAETNHAETISKDQFVMWVNTDLYFETHVPLHNIVEKIVNDHFKHEATLNQAQFLLFFTNLTLLQVRNLFIHLLSRKTQQLLSQNHEKREFLAVELSKRYAEEAEDSALDEETPNFNENPAEISDNNNIVLSVAPNLHRKQSILVGGTVRNSAEPGLRITLVGQCMLQHDIRTNPASLAKLAQLEPFLRGEIIFSELESALIPPNSDISALNQRKTIFFHAAEPSVLEILQENCGINLLGLSNNHAFDLGEPGLRYLMQKCDEFGIKYSGIGGNIAEAGKPCYLGTKFGQIALISFASKVPAGSEATETAPGVNSLSMLDTNTQQLNKIQLKRLLETIYSTANQAELTIVYQHNHYFSQNSPVNIECKVFSNWRRKLAHQIIDSGAGIYLSHGTPRLEGIEIYKNCPIFYGLGNFFFQTKTEVGFYTKEVWSSVIVTIHSKFEGEDGRNQQKNEWEYTIDPTKASPISKNPSALGDNRGNLSKAHNSNVINAYSIKLTPIILNEIGENYSAEVGSDNSLHLSTRGIPQLASREQGMEILLKLQELSEQFGTVIEVEESAEDGVIGWVQSKENRTENHRRLSLTTANTPCSPCFLRKSLNLTVEQGFYCKPIQSFLGTSCPLFPHEITSPSTLVTP
jgi:poly-gamma-glutamate capsule biosynthesis protein CapA/YwtB (metallophosphatase superfamily)